MFALGFTRTGLAFPLRISFTKKHTAIIETRTKCLQGYKLYILPLKTPEYNLCYIRMLIMSTNIITTKRKVVLME